MRERDLLRADAARSSRVWISRLADDAGDLGLGRHVLGRERRDCESGPNVSVEPLVGDLVAVADDVRERDLGARPLGQRAHTVHRLGRRRVLAWPGGGMNENGMP